MKFENHRFSKRFPEIACNIFVVHEPVRRHVLRVTPKVHTLPDYRATAAAIIEPAGQFWIGVCCCAPGDQFVKATGRAKALGRAYQELLKGSQPAGRLPCEILGKGDAEILNNALRDAIWTFKKDRGFL